MDLRCWEGSGRLTRFLYLLIGAAIAGVVISTVISQQTPAQAMAGGDTTVFNRTSRAYEQPSANLSQKGLDEHFEGDLAFDSVFVTAPARVNPGLGPQFNNASCTGCHIRNGRGLPEVGQLLVRVGDSRPQATNADLGQYHSEAVATGENVVPVPGLGTQIQDQAVYGSRPEATVAIEWAETSGEYADGEPYTLRSPKATITLPDGRSLSEDILTSLRIPPPIYGLGLLEAVPEETLLGFADPEDQNGDGISGQLNRVWDVAQQKAVLGRFGLKANQPNLRQQTAAAYVNDMGVTNPVFTEADGSNDIGEDILKAATIYAQTLAVPARTLTEEKAVQRGEKLFEAANCVACHVQTLKTGTHPDYAELSHQVIHPYTDLLLHDLGPGLADNRPDFQASGTEWRTPALWGIGLTQTVLPYSSFLHDGRAPTFEEAILWHGGEAEPSKQAFINMPKTDRAALTRFLRSL